jgi:hypothetical protein
VTLSTSIVPFLNGISHVERLTARLGAAVLGGVLKVVTPTLALRVHNRRLAAAAAGVPLPPAA